MVELHDHYEESHYYCAPCARIFKNDYGLTEHYRQSDAHHYCPPCARLFQSAANLRAHLSSATHRPRDVQCPFRGCGLAFASRSALLLHLEGGACPSGADRNAVSRFVRQRDTHSVITDPARMIGGGGEVVARCATGAAWNGAAHECYLCHAGYGTLRALNQHLASARHAEKVYRCPLSSCGARFAALSALCQHIESERCGVSKFRAVQNTMDTLMGRMGRLTL